jgi:hypothetical protein
LMAYKTKRPISLLSGRKICGSLIINLFMTPF